MHRTARRAIVSLAALAAAAALTGCANNNRTSLVDTAPFAAGGYPQAPLVLGAGDAIGWSMYSSVYSDGPNGTFAGIPKVNVITANAPLDY